MRVLLDRHRNPEGTVRPEARATGCGASRLCRLHTAPHDAKTVLTADVIRSRRHAREAISVPIRCLSRFSVVTQTLDRDFTYNLNLDYSVIRKSLTTSGTRQTNLASPGQWDLGCHGKESLGP